MHLSDWQRAALILSTVMIIVVTVSAGVSAYRQFACTPTVERLADGTIIRHACVGGSLTWRTIAQFAAYLGGGVVVVSLLSWIFLGWPSDVLSRYFSHRKRRG
jgi:hypothetical protein